MIELLRKITLIFLTFQPRWVKKKRISYSIFQWVRPIHLDDEVGNHDPRIPAHARDFGADVERVLCEEVHSESFSKDIDDSHQEINSTSAGHSSRPSAAGTSASGYDGSRGGTDDRVDNGEEILMNVDIVNIQSANLLVKMISHTTHRMKTMALKSWSRHRSYWEAL